MPPTNNITRMLAARKIDFEAHELPDAKLGAQEAADFLGIDPQQMFKTIVAIQPDGGKPLLALAPGDSQIDLKALGRAAGGGKAKLASQSQAEEMTDLETGGISPLAILDKGFKVFIDESARNFGRIYLSGGQRGLNLSLSLDDLRQLTGAKFSKFCK